MNFKCPICGGPLGYERSDDGILVNKITERDNGETDVYEICNKSNGYELVFCWDHKLSHKIPEDLYDNVLTFIRG